MARRGRSNLASSNSEQESAVDTWTGAKWLWSAVLLDAVRLLTNASSKDSSKEVFEARRWFASPEIDVGSFIWVCRNLDIEPDWFRQKLSARLLLERANNLARDSSPLLKAPGPRRADYRHVGRNDRNLRQIGHD